MSTEKPTSPSDRLSALYKQLATAATALNKESGELTRWVSALDAAVQTLNIGLTTWTRFVDQKHEDGTFGIKELGYARIHGKWGIALRIQSGHGEQPESLKQEEWLFNEAPRQLRLAAVDRLPELFEKLIQKTESTTRKIAEKTQFVRELATAVSGVKPSPLPGLRRPTPKQ